METPLNSSADRSIERPLSRSLLIRILVTSSLISAALTTLSFLIELRAEMHAMNVTFRDISKSSAPVLAGLLWNLNEEQIERQALGILAIKDVARVKVFDESDSVSFQQTKREAIDKGFLDVRTIELFFPDASTPQLVGRLEITTTMYYAYERLIRYFLSYLITQTTKTFFVSFVILYIVQMLVVRYLERITRFLIHYDYDTLDQSKRTVSLNKSGLRNEINVLEDAVNRMSLYNLRHLITERQRIRFETEIEAAELIQKSFFARKSLTQETGLSTLHYSAERTGGDWMRHSFHEASGIAFYDIGDVTGHGVRAAMLTGVICGVLETLDRGYGSNVIDPRASESIEDQLKLKAQRLNEIVYTACQEEVCTTGLFMALDTHSGQIWLLNAGHCQPLIVIPQTQEVQPIVAINSRLGTKVDQEFLVQSQHLQAGSSVFSYTDGLVENTPGTFSAHVLQLRKVKAILKQHANDIHQALKGIQELIEDQHKRHTPDDDVAVMSFSWRQATTETPTKNAS